MSCFIISHLFFWKVTTENKTCICFDKNSWKKSNFVQPFLPVRTKLLYKVDDETPCKCIILKSIFVNNLSLAIVRIPLIRSAPCSFSLSPSHTLISWPVGLASKLESNQYNFVLNLLIRFYFSIKKGFLISYH